MSADLAILIPMWGRPHRVWPVYESARHATPGARVVFIVSEDDRAVHDAVGRLLIDTLPSADGFLAGENVAGIETSWPGGHPGDYARKINYAFGKTTEPLVFMGADDLHFHPGWYERALRHLRPGISVVGTNDLGNPRTRKGLHSTHSLVTRSYVEELGTIDEPGKVLHEGYWHEFVDDEFVRTAQYRNAFEAGRDVWVEHLHPHWGKAPSDASYEMQGERMTQGRALFMSRQHLWDGTVQ